MSTELTEKLVDFARGYTSIMDDVQAHPRVTVPPWDTKKHKSGRATVMLALSDCHFDEVVRPSEVLGKNKYNRRVATDRLYKVGERVPMLCRTYMRHVKFDGLMVACLGDMLSGMIHDELDMTNADTVLGGIVYWSEHLANILAGWSKWLPVHVVGVPGNHGRLRRKPRYKLRVRENLDWLLMQMVARNLRGHRVTFDLPEAAETITSVYNCKYLVIHGDQFRGGGGITGAIYPVAAGVARKAVQAVSIRRSFDYVVMGHWHYTAVTGHFIVNGSLKGFDEYALLNNFEFQRPTQLMWLSTPEHGATWFMPVFAD